MERFQSTLPARGATRRSLSKGGKRKYFNPRSLHGERPCRRVRWMKWKSFQSTLPARGATILAFFVHGCAKDFNPRSLHGERRHRLELLRPHDDFNPRSLHGERPGTALAAKRRCKFQSTLPARGATLLLPAPLCSQRISIHAPCTGSDSIRKIDYIIHTLFQSTLPARGATNSRSSLRRPQSYFNPRSLHGERQIRAWNARYERKFQSTLPARGATANIKDAAVTKAFQSTLPARGATLRIWKVAPAKEFQSTLPARGATPEWLEDEHGFMISIHAPCTGSDPRPRRLPRWAINFNPRSLHGERLRAARNLGESLDISIHAPCTGSDRRASLPT